MKEYLNFVWESTIHPREFVDMLPAIQLVLFVTFLYFAIKTFISIYKLNKHEKK
jgi:hypothetical protein